MNHSEVIASKYIIGVPDYANSGLRQNNFELLRFVFAFIVFLVNAHVLSGAEPLSLLSSLFSSEIAVKSFFVVSGFLIFMSYENTQNAKEFFIKRVRRIYPAYFFIVVASALFGGIFSSYAWNGYLSLSVLKFIVANSLFLNFLQPTLPSLFENNPLQAVNGALWTLKIEVMFYFFVPLAVTAFRKIGRMPVIIGLYVVSVLYSAAMIELARRTGTDSYLELQRQLPGQLAFFMAGAAGYYYFQYLEKYGIWLAAIAVAAFTVQAWLPWMAIQPAALAILVVYFACVFPCVGNFGKYGDFSYGIYIVHFPILQTLIAQRVFKDSPWLMLSIAGVLVVSIAVLLWHRLEKAFLRKSSHYIEACQS